MRYSLYIMSLAVGALAVSCADEFDQAYPVPNKPANIAEYEYLNDYAPLKEYVSNPNFMLGAALSVDEFNNGGVVYQLATSNFTEVVAGNAMKMASCVGNDGSMNFSKVSDFVSKAKEAGLGVYGHTLAWHSQQSKKYLTSLIAPTIIPAEPVEGGSGGHALVLKNESGNGSDNWSGQTWYVFDKPLSNGVTYTMSFMVKGTDAYNMGAWFKIGGDGEQIYHQPGSFNITTEWVEVSNTFTVDKDGVDRFIFNFGDFAQDGAIYIDNIKFIESGSTENLIKNSEFEEGHCDGWSYWSPGTNYAVSEDGQGYSVGGKPGYALKLVNESGNGNDNWSGQTWFVLDEPLSNGVTYTFSFMAKATEAYNMGAWFKTGGDGEQIYHQPGNFNFTTEWAEVSNTFTVDKDGIDRFIFNFGNYSKEGTLFIDNIKLCEVGGDNLIKNGDFEEQHVEGWAYWTPGQNYALSELGEGYSLNAPEDIVIEKTAEEKKAILSVAFDNWIAGMMNATGGYVKAWDVVNEAISGGDFNGDGDYDLQSESNVSESDKESNFYWQDYLGDIDYVRIAVSSARRHFKANGGEGELKLFINDYNLESTWDDNKKLKSLVNWIKKWECDTVKIDGIGSQMHISYNENQAAQKKQEECVVNMLTIMAGTGKLVRISELDMGYNDKNGTSLRTSELTEEQHKNMAKFYTFIVEKYLEIVPAAQQYGICQWCLTDAADDSGWRKGEPVGLWDRNYNRKHTYGGFAEGLK